METKKRQPATEKKAAPKKTVAKKAAAPAATVVKEKPQKKTGNKVKIPKASYYGTGKRKTAIAKVWIFKGVGNVLFNDQPANAYLGRDILTTIVKRPLAQLNLQDKYDVFVSASGGGIPAQAVAAQLGVARALLTVDAAFRSPLKKEGFISRDSRIKERKKYGKKRARKGPQYRKR